jgi:hypothetical protein
MSSIQLAAFSHLDDCNATQGNTVEHFGRRMGPLSRPGRIERFVGTMVPTYNYGTNQAYHYKRNAETCMLLGDMAGEWSRC